MSRPAELEELFHRARELSGAERERFLAELARRGSPLLEELRALLERDAEETLGVLRAGPVPAADGPGVRVGRYRLLRVLGEGGMGTVHLAEQEEPIHRLVALKQVRVGRNTAEVAERFKAERQALAQMNHPGIAAIHDGGVTDSGLPYFVMEYVPGLPLDRYCDHERLSVRARLRLFVRVAEAVQHAHQKGIIHRDLKPSNVLVGELGGEPAPKIIDFGVARALSGSLAGESLALSSARVSGTSLYMSPEQARGDEVDTRSDVFSLGVTLYLLVTGVLPFDPEELARLGTVAAVRRRMETDPPAPSARVAALGQGAAALAGARRTVPRALVRALRGDVDWIVMRALARDREQRYPSASELAADVARHLRHEPVNAAPPRPAYRFAKLVRRHRLASAALAALVALSVAAAVVASTLAAWARDAEARARIRAAHAREIADQLELGIEDGALAAELGREPSLRELFRDPLADLGQRYADRPAVEAGVLTALGRVLLNLGEDERARELLLRANLLQQERTDVAAYDRFETLDALIQAERRARGPGSARPYVAAALAAARGVLVDLGPAEQHSLEALLSFQAGGDVPGAELLPGLDVLLAEIPDELQGRDPRAHGIGRVALEVGARMVERDLPETDEYFARLGQKADTVLALQAGARARFFWALARALTLRGHERRESARPFVRELHEASRSLPADHWVRREAERLGGLVGE